MTKYLSYIVELSKSTQGNNAFQVVASFWDLETQQM